MTSDYDSLKETGVFKTCIVENAAQIRINQVIFVVVVCLFVF